MVIRPNPEYFFLALFFIKHLVLNHYIILNLVSGNSGEDHGSFLNNFKISFSLVRQDDNWLISGAKILR